MSEILDGDALQFVRFICQLPGDLTVPKGVIFVMLPYAMHRDPKLFSDPLKFNPDRFLDEENIPPFSYMPFSAGEYRKLRGGVFN